MMMDKAFFKKQSFKDTKVSVSVFSADISKSEEISRWRPIDKTLHYDFSATGMFFKNRHNCLLEALTFFPAMGSTRSKTKHSPSLQGNRQTDTHTHTHTHTDCYNPPPTLGIKIHAIPSATTDYMYMKLTKLSSMQVVHVSLIFYANTQ